MTSNNTSAYSTGGGGFRFENRVEVSYLIQMLSGDPARGYPDGSISEISFQQRWKDFDVDDIVINLKTKKANKKLALQIKKDLIFSDAESNLEFKKVISECWQTFSRHFDLQSNKGIKVGVGIGVYHTSLDNHLKRLLVLAVYSKNHEEFFKKIKTKNFVSKDKRKFLQIFEKLLREIKQDISPKEIWLFLRNFVVLYFDVEDETGEVYRNDLASLKNCLKEKTLENTLSVYSYLHALASEYSISGGTISLSSLREKISEVSELEESVDFSSDLNRLRDHSKDNIERIRSLIGKKVGLIRENLMNKLQDSIEQSDLTVVHGEPLSGKSVILKLLAKKLQKTGDVIFLSPIQLSGKSLEEFCRNLKFENKFSDMLQNTNNSDQRCIFIDGLDNINDENKRIIINDIIREVITFNENSPKQSHWKIVCSCRTLDMENILRHMETRQIITANNFQTLEISELTHEEIFPILTHFPSIKLSHSTEKYQKILYMPGILDLFTLPKVNLASLIPEKITYSVIVQILWHEVIRLADGQRTGVGDPNKREAILIDFAKQLLSGKKSFILNTEFSNEIQGLISDRILVKDGTVLEFAHDAYRDWSLLKLIQTSDGSLNQLLKSNNNNPLLLPAFRLYSATILEVEQKTSKWQSVFSDIQNDSELSPKWLQNFEASLVLSPLLKQHLQNLHSFLFENKNAVLKKIIKSTKIFSVQPNTTSIFQKGTLLAEKYAPYNTIPIKEKWKSLIEFILDNKKIIDDECLEEISEFFTEFITKTSGKEQLQEEILVFCTDLLENRFLIRASKIKNHSLSYEIKKKIRENLILVVLYGLRILPDKMKKFIQTNALQNRGEKKYGFEKEILKNGWIPLCGYAPEFSVSLLTSIFCEEIKPDSLTQSYFHLSNNYGLKHDFQYLPPTYLKGPFLGLLRRSSKHGIKLIQNLANHSVNCWKILEEQDSKSPIPHTIQFPDFETQVWGNEYVYGWYRHPSNAPHLLTCALMALEYWMNEEIAKIESPQQLFSEIFKNNESAAIIGVCASVSLKNKEKCKEMMIPILSNPVFWRFDRARFDQDSKAEETMLITTFLPQAKSENKIPLELAKEEHRGEDISKLVPQIFLSSNSDLKLKLQEKILNFKNALPFVYENERINTEIKLQLEEFCDMCKELGMMKNYSISKNEMGVEYIEYTGEFKISDRQKQLLEEEQKYKNLEQLCNIGLNLLNNKIKPDETTLKIILDWALKIYDSIPNLNTSDEIPIEYLIKLNSSIAVISGLVIRNWDWLVTQNHHLTCKKIILNTSSLAWPTEFYQDFFCDRLFSRSISRCLPHLLLHFPNEKKLSNLILNYSADYHDEIRAFIFENLKVHWTKNEEIIWKSIDNLLKQLKTNRKNFKSLKPEQDIRTKSIMSIIMVIPTDLDIDKIKTKSELLGLIINLLEFTANAFLINERDDQYSEWSMNPWNSIVFLKIIYILLFSSGKYDEKILEPIMKKWEKIPSLMESFLSQLTLMRPQPHLEDRFVSMWNKIAGEVLESNFCNITSNYYLQETKRDIISHLIFVAFSIPINIDNTKILFIPKIIPYLERWCEKFAIHKNCYIMLLRFLKDYGVELLSEYGIKWIYHVFTKVENVESFLEETKVTNYLAEILWDFWHSENNNLKKEQQNFEYFTFVVDRLANTGDKSALDLQQKINSL